LLFCGDHQLMVLSEEIRLALVFCNEIQLSVVVFPARL
jgi:hypothetical protein